MPERTFKENKVAEYQSLIQWMDKYNDMLDHLEYVVGNESWVDLTLDRIRDGELNRFLNEENLRELTGSLSSSDLEISVTIKTPNDGDSSMWKSAYDKRINNVVKGSSQHTVVFERPSAPNINLDLSHTHTKEEITDFDHTHTISEITDFDPPTAGAGILFNETENKFEVDAGFGLEEHTRLTDGIITGRGLALKPILSGSNEKGALLYNGITKTDGSFYGGEESPTSNDRLNYGGTLYAKDTIATSDKNLKKNIESLDPQECHYIVCSLNPRSFNWKDSDKEDHGLIAQEVAKVAPLMTPDNKSVNYSKLTTYLIGSNQVLSDNLIRLNDRIDQLENLVFRQNEMIELLSSRIKELDND